MVFDVNYIVVTFSIFDISRDPSDASAYTINFIIHISLYYIKFTKNSGEIQLIETKIATILFHTWSFYWTLR